MSAAVGQGQQIQIRTIKRGSVAEAVPYLSFPSALRGAGIIDPEPVCDGAGRQGTISRFDTMALDSSPNPQACWNTTAPSRSVCSLNTMPAAEAARNRASLALRSFSGGGRSFTSWCRCRTFTSESHWDRHLGCRAAE
jgi:hypothetical protein